MTGEQVRQLYRDAVRATAGTGLFPEVMITQLILESGPSLSSLARRANNFFGIKSGAAWTGKVISMSTSEYSGSTRYTVPGTGKIYANRRAALADGAQAPSLFRYYDTATEGLRGWVQFLQQNPRYTRAGVFAARNPVEQFAALARAGYATDPRYVQKLVSVYTRYKEFFFSSGAAGATGGTFLIIAALIVLFRYLR